MNFYNEHDPKAAAWLRELIKQGHIAPGVVDERSIEDIAPSEFEGFTQVHFFAGIGGWPLAFRLAGWPDDRPAWSGSCPCQPFSIGGKGAGVSDERHLWPACKWHIAQCQPTIVFGEQVASKDGREWLAGVRLDLEDMGYAVGAADLCAAGVSAQHVRQRIYFMAHASGAGRKGLEPFAMGVSSGQGQTLPVYGNPLTDARRFLGAHFDSLLPSNGLSLRVERGAIKGFGNAIVPQVAAEFIQASIEAINYKL